MSRRSVSTTAQLTTLARAALSTGNGLIRDECARVFLEVPWRQLLPFLRGSVARWPWIRELLVNVGARTCFFDELLKDAMVNGIGQVVILGAGFDSRAIRFAQHRSRFFEVDQLATQDRKRTLLAKAGLLSPAIYVTADLEKDSLAECLAGAGFDAALPSFLLCEGLVEYLSAEAVDELLRALRELAAPGSLLVLNPLYRSTGRARLYRMIEKLAARWGGEHRKFRADPAEAVALLRETGWRSMQVREAEALYDRYLANTLPPPRFRHNYVIVAAPVDLEGPRP
jgi:methyltransferase (TIGR00027 family)